MTETLVATPDPEPHPALVWDDDIPQVQGEEALDVFLARQLLRSRYPDFAGDVEAFILVARFTDEDGARSVAQVSSKHTHYTEDRGLLETALDEYRNLGVMTQLPEGDEEEEGDEDASEAA